jgi:hypothetical protein
MILREGPYGKQKWGSPEEIRTYEDHWISSPSWSKPYEGI